MKSNSTTEERAEAHLNGRKPIIESFASQEKLSNDAKRSILFHCYKDYHDGATEQRVIDEQIYTEEMRKLNEEWLENLKIQREMLIDKACEWLINTYLGDYVTDEYGNGNIGNNAKLAEDFRKAMEK